MPAESAGTLAGFYTPAGLTLAGAWEERWGGGSGGWSCLLDGTLYEAAGEDEESPEAAIARGWATGGEAFLRSLRGEFTLLLWDREARRGILACDRSGGRTAFVHSRGDTVHFGAELGPLLAVMPHRPDPDADVVATHLAGVNTRDGRTLFAGVRQLGYGMILELAPGGRPPRRYFQHRPEPLLEGTPAELAATLREGVAASIRARAPAGTATAASLSGGLDSSSVTAIAHWARGASAAPLRTYSAVFPGDESSDESGEVMALRRALGIDGVCLQVAPSGLVRSAGEYLHEWHSPVEGPGYVLDAPLMAAAAADGMEIVVDGQGGDEAYAAPAFVVADRLRRFRVGAALGLVRRLPRYGAFPGPRTAAMLLRHYGGRALVPAAIDERLARLPRTRAGAPAWLAPDAAAVAAAHDRPWAWKRIRGPRWWASEVDAFTVQRERSGLADYTRRRAATAGMVGRPPLLDADLAALILRLPPEAGFDPRFNRALIRESLRDIAPDQVRLRPRKTNLGSFYHRALIADLPVLRRLLDSPATEVRAYTRAREVRALVESPPAEGGPDWLHWAGAVWTLANVELWLRVQTGQEAVAAILNDWGLSPMAAEPVAV